MSKLFFIDESGHDHGEAPFEVRGGFVIHIENLKNFIDDVMQLEIKHFGTNLNKIKNKKKELKGRELLSKNTIKAYEKCSKKENFNVEEVKMLKNFLEDESNDPNKKCFYERNIYACAKINFVTELLELMIKYNCTIIASMIPNNIENSKKLKEKKLFRNDFKGLIKIYHEHLDRFKENGIFVLDESEPSQDRSFFYSMKEQYLKNKDFYRLYPIPFFVSSETHYPIMVADICIYIINWSFRIDKKIEANLVREKMKELFQTRIEQLQYKGKWKDKDLQHNKYGIFISEP